MSLPQNAVAQAQDGSVTRYICLSENELTEEVHKKPSSFVGYAKPSTFVTFIVHDGKRIIISVDDKDNLQKHEYNADDNEWVTSPLGAEAHPQTQIATIYDEKDELRAYFQGKSGGIQELIVGDDGVRPGPKKFPVTKPVKGSSLSAIMAQGVIRVFYAHEDNSIHEVSSESGEWKDTQVPSTNGAAARQIAAVVNDDQYFVQYINPQNEVTSVYDGKEIKIGKLQDNGHVVKVDSSEAEYFDFLGTVVINGPIYIGRGWPW